MPRSNATTLAAIRIIVAAQALWILLSRDPAGISGLPNEIWQLVGDDTRSRFLLTPGVPAIENGVWVVTLASLACVMLGWRTRIFGIVAAVGLYHLAPLLSLLSVAGPWGKGLTIATLALPILACSPCEDRWSVRAQEVEHDPEAYGWAVTLVRLLFAQIYLFTALGRLLAGGLDWVSVDTVRTHLLVFSLAYPQLDSPLHAWLAARPAICALIAGATLLFEAFFVVAAFVSRARLPLAAAGVLFHATLWITLGFRYPNLPHFLLFIDWRDPPARRHRPALETLQ